MSADFQQSPETASCDLSHDQTIAIVLASLIDDSVREQLLGGLDGAASPVHTAVGHDATFSNSQSLFHESSQESHPMDKIGSPTTMLAQNALLAPAREELIAAAPPVARKLVYSDFQEGRVLGTGSYSTVRLCTRDGKEYAMKIMEKKLILKEKKEKFAKMERDILNLLSHPNVVGMHWCFQDEYSLFFVLDYCSGGELFQLLRELGSLSLECGTFVLAEIVCALSHIHGHGVIHRDLKPENILLSSEGRIKVSDFGAACFANDDSLRKTFCGTAQYVSPEMLNEQNTCLGSDLWALGCIVYQIFSGKLLFNGDSEYLTFQLIVADPLVLSFPSFFPPLAETLVRDLVKADPRERLGVRPDGSIDYGIIRSHPFFSSIDWENLHTTSPPPMAPLVARDVIHPPSPSKTDSNDCVDASRSQVEEDFIETSSQRYIRFLLPGERVMFHSNFKKKLFWGLFFERDRTLVLTDTPRLIYLDPVTNVFKGRCMRAQRNTLLFLMVLAGEIPWSAELQVLPRSSTGIRTPGSI
jgi:3-phosphoinositide dependent protein kinase-1